MCKRALRDFAARVRTCAKPRSAADASFTRSHSHERESRDDVVLNSPRPPLSRPTAFSSRKRGIVRLENRAACSALLGAAMTLLAWRPATATGRRLQAINEPRAVPAWLRCCSMQLLALFTPEGGQDAVWRVRLFPAPPPCDVPSLTPEGEFLGLGAPNFDELDKHMLEARAAYRKRQHSSGVTEVTASTTAGSKALCKWVAALIRAHSTSAPEA
jgi:hypothetical protein